jgi:putative ABC transport system permease protein
MIQALIFGIIGFIVAYLLLEAFRKGIANAGTIFQFSILVKIGLLVVTLVISLFGAVFAIRRIRKIEPAAVFRG